MIKAIRAITAAVTFCMGSVVYADPAMLEDMELEAIAGKLGQGNQLDLDNADVRSGVADDSDVNIQWALYQWRDVHTVDASSHKGANDQSGAASQVQSSAVGQSNFINWGATIDGKNVVGNAGSVNQLSIGRANYAAGGS